MTNRGTGPAIPRVRGRSRSSADRVLVVLPTYNEALNLPLLIPRILLIRPTIDVLVVDDASPDGTGEVVGRLIAREGTRVGLLERRHKSGRGGAVMAGFKRALTDDRYGWFVEMDADQSHQPEELPRLMAAAQQADMVVGARYLPGGRIDGWSRRRLAWSQASNLIIRRVLGVPMTDFTNGYRIYNRRAAELLASANLRETGFITLSEWAYTIHRSGLTIGEVPTVFINRQLGQSNMSASEAIGAVRALVRMRARPPRARRLRAQD
jgi:glycosyltransferase involved in cell wall biosynthesis